MVLLNTARTSLVLCMGKEEPEVEVRFVLYTIIRKKITL